MVEITLKRSLTDKEKSFVRAYVICRNPVEAYHAAGYDPKRTEYSTKIKALLKLQDPKIQEYLKVVEDQEKTIGKMRITQERILDMLEEDREFARDCKSPAAAISATKLLGQTIGMFKSGPEVQTNHIMVTNPPSADDKAFVASWSQEEVDRVIKLLQESK